MGEIIRKKSILLGVRGHPASVVSISVVNFVTLCNNAEE